MSSTLAYRLLTEKQVLVVVHGAMPPSDSDWNKLVEEVTRAAPRRELRALVFTEGGAPNAAQRIRLTQGLFGYEMPIAVVSDSTLARTVVTAFSLFNPRIRAFASLPKAADHLRLEPDAQSEATAAYVALRARVAAQARISSPRIGT